MIGWDNRAYRCFRIIFGTYLFVHFASLLPWATELFSADGVMTASVSPLMTFANPLGWFDTPEMAIGLVGFAMLASIGLTVGFHDRVFSVLIWVVWATLFARNPLIANPSLPFVGWLLLWHAAVPFRDTREWRLPRSFYGLAWALTAVGYTFGGLTKLNSPSWLDGSALRYVLGSPLARPGFVRDLLLTHPDVLTWMTFGVLALEVGAVVLALSKATRPLLWVALVGMHVGILLTIDFADLTVGMLMISIVTFDPAWLSGFRGRFESLFSRKKPKRFRVDPM